MKRRILFIKSKEILPCPTCGGRLIVRDSRKRKIIQSDGRCETYQIRRLCCKSCGKIHSELADFMHPHKNYASDVVQGELDQTRASCPAEDSTIARWKAAFEKHKQVLEGLLQALWLQVLKKPLRLLHPISLLETLKNQKSNWLSFVHRALINHGFSIHTQFAWCPS